MRRESIANTNDQLVIDEFGKVTSYRMRRPRVLKQFFVKDSRYPYIRLTVNGRAFTRSVVALVAGTFVRNPDELNLTEAMLIDQNPNNICPSNIRWVTKSYLHRKITRTRDGVTKKFASKHNGITRNNGSWSARLMKNGIRHYIGCFPTAMAARNARLQYEAEHPELLDNI